MISAIIDIFAKPYTNSAISTITNILTKTFINPNTIFEE